MNVTPTPWRLSRGNKCIVMGADEEIVCDSYGSPRPREVEEANAAFIVKAVNAHDIMVEALRDVVINAAFNLSADVAAARAALAAAGEQV